MSAKCQHCGKESRVISRVLGSCLDCIRQEFFSVLPNIEEAHTKAGSLFDLPVHPPASATGPLGIMIPCPLTAWLIGSAPVVQVPAILSSPTVLGRSMAIRTWLFSTRLVPLIAYFAIIGNIAARHWLKTAWQRQSHRG